MINTLRLFYFDTTRGTATALKVLVKTLGPKKAITLAAKLQWRLHQRSPFRMINQGKSLSESQKLSQKQMAPMIVLYDMLREDGYSKSETLALLKTLGDHVATEFLKFNVPIIKRNTYGKLSKTQKISALSTITRRFFNADATLTLDDADNFQFTVNHCHFAHYCKALGYPELATLFCSADKLFFDQYQDDIVFFRSQTLAEQQQPCDFQFTWHSPTP